MFTVMDNRFEKADGESYTHGEMCREVRSVRSWLQGREQSINEARERIRQAEAEQRSAESLLMMAMYDDQTALAAYYVQVHKDAKSRIESESESIMELRQGIHPSRKYLSALESALAAWAMEQSVQ